MKSRLLVAGFISSAILFLPGCQGRFPKDNSHYVNVVYIASISYGSDDLAAADAIVKTNVPEWERFYGTAWFIAHIEIERYFRTGKAEHLFTARKLLNYHLDNPVLDHQSRLTLRLFFDYVSSLDGGGGSAPPRCIGSRGTVPDNLCGCAIEYSSLDRNYETSSAYLERYFLDEVQLASWLGNYVASYCPVPEWAALDVGATVNFSPELASSRFDLYKAQIADIDKMEAILCSYQDYYIGFQDSGPLTLFIKQEGVDCP